MSVRDKLRVLVVDDMSTSRGLLLQGLDNLGISQVEYAESGSSAIASLSRRPVHLVLSDYHMPGMDGESLARRLRQDASFRDLPVIALSSLSDRQNTARGAFDAWLVKPVRASQLMDAVANALYEGATRTARSVATSLSSSGATDPARPGERDEAAPRPAAGQAAGGPVPTLLLIEDNAVNQLVFESYLSGWPVRVVTASDGNEGLALARAEAPDLIVSDICMPGLDGYEVARALRAEGVEIPIVAATANVLPEDARACREAGMDDVLTKPVSRERIADMLRTWLPAALPGEAPDDERSTRGRARG